MEQLARPQLDKVYTLATDIALVKHVKLQKALGSRHEDVAAVLYLEHRANVYVTSEM